MNGTVSESSDLPVPLQTPIGVFLVIIIPFVSAIVGWGTNVVALEMTFYPLEFVGCFKPYLGWQGIIPRKAKKMTEIAVELITSKLLTVREVFARLDPAEVTRQLQPHMLVHSKRLVEAAAVAHMPGPWSLLGEGAKGDLAQIAATHGLPYVTRVFEDLQRDIEGVFDLKEYCIKTLLSSPGLLVSMFQSVGAAEFDFIRRSGAYLGFIFGVVQMIIYIFYPAGWVLPAAGILVGTATNYIALKVLFNPVDPVERCGCVFQGLFLQRQAEVAIAYADVVSEKVINPPELVRALLEGPSAASVFSMVRHRMEQCVDDYVSSGRVLVSMTLGQRQFQAIKYELACHMMDELPILLGKISPYTAEVLDVEAVLRSRLISLPSAEFESLLHPIFEEDEFQLIALGSVLGGLAGALQFLVAAAATGATFWS